MKKELPQIKVTNDVLTISITASDIKHLVETKLNEKYKLIGDPVLYLNDLKFQLENYTDSNGQETGLSLLQQLIDQMIDETYVDGSPYIINENFDSENEKM